MATVTDTATATQIPRLNLPPSLLLTHTDMHMHTAAMEIPPQIPQASILLPNLRATATATLHPLLNQLRNLPPTLLLNLMRIPMRMRMPILIVMHKVMVMVMGTRRLSVAYLP